MEDNLYSAFHTAFLAAQKEMRDPVKDGNNPHFRSRFVTLKGVLDAVRAPLHKHGITVSQAIDFGEGGTIAVITTLAHTTGQTITSRCPVICAKQNDPQALGSAITYARRYAVAALCGVAPSDDDDDGEAAAAPTRQTAKPEQKPFQPRATAKPEPVVVADLAEPFELAEHAVAAIQQSLTEADLKGTMARIRASKFEGEDKAMVKQAWEARTKLPVRSV